MTAANGVTLAELLAARSEAEFQRNVVSLARSNGWTLLYHTQNSLGSQRGFPDLFLARPRGDGRVVWIELKGPKTPVTREQQEWIDGLVRCGQEAYIFRPCDEDQVQAVLR